MADQLRGSDDWRPIQSPDGRVFYFNSRTNETLWVPPTPPSTSAATPASSPRGAAPSPVQNNAGSPTYQNPNSHVPSSISYPSSAAASPNANSYLRRRLPLQRTLSRLNPPTPSTCSIPLQATDLLRAHLSVIFTSHLNLQDRKAPDAQPHSNHCWARP